MFRSSAYLTLLFMLAGQAEINAGWLCGGGGCKPDNCSCQVKWVCCPTYEKEKIEKSGFEVEREHICVPKVKLPWQDCCTPRCARVICVNRLKKKSIECGEKCVLQWEAKPVYVRCCKPGYNGCPMSNCCPTPCDDISGYPQPSPATGLQPVPNGELPAPPAL